MLSPTLILTLSTLLTPLLATPAPLPAGPLTPDKSYLIMNADIYSTFLAGTNTDKWHTPEKFNLTVMGAWAGSMPVLCTLDWDASIANGKFATTEPFACSDPSVYIAMERGNVTPMTGWDVHVHLR
jgi:hypothetical protein